MKEGIKDLIDGISVYIDSKLNNVYSLNMMTGVIKSVNGNKYTVTIYGKDYPNIEGINGIVNYKKNDIVKILCTKNKTKILEMIILGKLSNIEKNDIAINFAEKIYNGAVSAGYEGTAEQFGADLFALIK